MATRLSELTTTHNNNFTLIRFIAATMVLVSHSYTLAGIPFHPYAAHFGMTIGVVGLDIFFFTSGFLVTSSLINRKDIFAFAWARFLRIYPALVVAVIVSIFIGLYFTHLSTAEYFQHKVVQRFFIDNSILWDGIRFQLPGVFSDNPRHAVNGSLWTLAWEIKMYFILFCIGMFIYIKPYLIKVDALPKIFIFIFIISLLVLYGNHFYHFVQSVHVKPAFRFMTLFFIGAFLYVKREHIFFSHRIILIILVALFISDKNPNLYYIIHYAFIGYIILYLAYIPSGIIANFNKLGDYSYGIYIYAFPITQSIISLYPKEEGVYIALYSFVITLFLSVLSWHLLEKKMLTYKNSYLNIKNKISNKFRKINE